MQLTKKRFPHCHCTVYKLRKLYRVHRINKKKIRFGKTMPIRSIPHAHQEAMEMQGDVQSAVLAGFRILYLDEMMVTKRTFPSHDWSALKSNTELAYQNM